MTSTSEPTRHGSSIGQPLTRRDGPLKVKGQARFAADNLPPAPCTRRSAWRRSPGAG